MARGKEAMSFKDQGELGQTQQLEILAVVYHKLLNLVFNGEQNFEKVILALTAEGRAVVEDHGCRDQLVGFRHEESHLVGF